MISFVIWISIVLCVGAFGARYMPGTWYANLRKPLWNPPNWIFAPVWTSLYIMMAAAAAIVYTRTAPNARLLPIFLFLLQLVLNGAWSYLFFGAQNIGGALAEICIMWLAILATTIAFLACAPIAGWLLVPYLCWVTFAAFLNFTIWRLNR